MMKTLHMKCFFIYHLNHTAYVIINNHSQLKVVFVSEKNDLAYESAGSIVVGLRAERQ